MHAIKRTSRRGQPRVYYLSNNWRGKSPRQLRNPALVRSQGCRNWFSAQLGDVDMAVIAMLREEVLTPDVVDTVVERAA